MRIDQLDLIRYGKFTDHAVTLPAAARDFHVIVGANEAGKSTLRSAIVHLLYGFPARSFGYEFLHGLPELRLGARLSHDGASLSFQRIKANKATLRAVDDSPLPDDALAPLLGATDARFFEQMFSLDHDRLVQGGASILSAADDDVGQVLFESAAGIASLGMVREQLEREADGLWARRKSAQRLYYQAEQLYEQARQRLRAASLKARDWADAHELRQRVDAELQSARQQHAELQARRALLQRIRRVAPLLATLDAHAAALHEHAQVPELPDTAGATLDDAERRLAAAEAARTHHLRARHAAEAALQAPQPDRALLERADDVTELDELRVQYRAYAGDIDKRRQEVQAHWAVAAELAAQLGWPVDDEQALAARVPPLPARTALARLARAHGAIEQRLQSAQRACRQKDLEREQADAELQRLARASVAPALRAALSQARQLGDVDAAQRALQADVATHQRTLDSERRALGDARDERELAGMLAPQRQLLQSMLDAEQRDDAETTALQRQQQRVAAQLAETDAAIQRLRQRQHPVLLEDVQRARGERDDAWAQVLRDPASLHERADDYRELVARADLLADQRHDRAHEAAELQALHDTLAGQRREQQSLAGQLAALAAQRVQRDARWDELRLQAGLPALPRHAAMPWLEARERVLAAAERLALAQARLRELQGTARQAALALARELRAAGAEEAGEALQVLLVQTEQWVREQDASSGRRQALLQQLDAADAARRALQRDADEALAARGHWWEAWSAALAEAGFAPDADPADIEASLALIQRIDDALGAMRGIRSERIDAMQRDLRAFEQRARELAQRVAPELAGRDGAEIALELRRRLADAHGVQAEAQRQRTTLAEAGRALAELDVEARQVIAALQPLLERAGTSERGELRRAIERSDARRRLQRQADDALQALLAQGDGLALAQLRAEIGAADPAQLVSELEHIDAQQDQLVQRMTELSAQQQAAAARLQAMAGAADAAAAEADRQEALARMGDAVERYIKVRTAARLLAWSIERYREARQGPMLTAAGNLFAQLTLGSFERLMVDFDSQPPTLQGRRSDGRAVGVEGMSDGTRDQLYLALRLAALHMHLERAHALPFVADDLFINFDDRRTRAGLQALAALSQRTQVLFLTHHDHLLDLVREVLGEGVNVVSLEAVR